MSRISLVTRRFVELVESIEGIKDEPRELFLGRIGLSAEEYELIRSQEKEVGLTQVLRLSRLLEFSPSLFTASEKHFYRALVVWRNSELELRKERQRGASVIRLSP